MPCMSGKVKSKPLRSMPAMQPAANIPGISRLLIAASFLFSVAALEKHCVDGDCEQYAASKSGTAYQQSLPPVVADVSQQFAIVAHCQPKHEYHETYCNGYGAVDVFKCFDAAQGIASRNSYEN